jgi:hypothetical protein
MITTVRSRAVFASFSLFAAAVTIGCGGTSSALVTQDGALLKADIAASVEQGFSAGESVSRSGGGSGGGSLAPEDVYFDDFFGLYANPVEGGLDYFLDEALTQPAGQERTTDSGVNGSDFSQTSTTQITAGPRAGYQSTSTFSFSSSRLDLSVTGTDPETGSFETTGFFEGGAGEFSARYTDEQGVSRIYAVRFDESGAYQVTFNTGASYVYTLNFLSDDSGTGTVTGSNDLLPAQIVWNTEGDGQMTFADGSVLEIRGFDFEQI